MTDFMHMLPWALLAAVLTGSIEVGVLHLLRNRSAAANIAALVTVPILAVLIFVITISGFMYSPALAPTANGQPSGRPRRPAGNSSLGSATISGRRWPGSGR